MTPPASPAALTHDAASAGENTHYYRQCLHELIEMGMGLTRRLHAQATAEPAPSAEPSTAPSPAPAPTPTPDISIAFDRIARSVRRSISLARRLDEPVAPARDHAAQRRVATRRHIIRAVEDTIQRQAECETAADSLHDELLERMDGPDLEEDIGDRPTADIIADICRDLGLGGYAGLQPWKRRTPDDIITLCARAAKPTDPPEESMGLCP